MARPVATDFLHSMRYQVVVDTGDRGISLAAEGRSDAGFSNVTTPEVTSEAVEYREGTYIYTQKYPGLPSMNDLTLSRGVARRDSTFWDWMRVTVEGSGEYRVDLSIRHFHRDTSLVRDNPAVDTVNLTRINIDTPARTYLVKEAFPLRHKVAGDLDATASEISIMELDVGFEHFEVAEGEAP